MLPPGLLADPAGCGLGDIVGPPNTGIVANSLGVGVVLVDILVALLGPELVKVYRGSSVDVDVESGTNFDRVDDSVALVDEVGPSLATAPHSDRVLPSLQHFNWAQ